MELENQKKALKMKYPSLSSHKRKDFTVSPGFNLLAIPLIGTQGKDIVDELLQDGWEIKSVAPTVSVTQHSGQEPTKTETTTVYLVKIFAFAKKKPVKAPPTNPVAASKRKKGRGKSRGKKK
jgi:hypothetical protein